MKPYRIAAVAVAAVLTLAGCSSTSNGKGTPASGGTSSTSPAPVTGNDNAALVPADLNTKVLNAVLAQKTFHLAGSGDDGSGSTLEFDIRYAANGASGTITIQGQKLELLVVGSDHFLEGSATFWQTALAGKSIAGVTAAVLGGKWAKVPGTGADFKDLFSLTDPREFLTDSVSDTSTVSKVGPTSFEGHPVIEFTDSSDGSKIYIQRYGAPLLLAVDAPAGSPSGSGSVRFTDYGKPYTVSAPAAADVIDLTPYFK